MNKKLLIGSLLLIVLALVISGCPTPGPGPGPTPTPISNPTCLKELPNGGTSVDISSFNGTYIYHMNTAQPAAKPESNSGPTTLYPYSLSTSAASSIISPNQVYLPEVAPAYSGVYSKKQVEADLKMRQAENDALVSRAAQLAPNRGVNPAPPASPVVGTTWNNVYIVVTENTISTTCRAVSDHAYFFVDNRNTSAMSGYLAAYCTAFDAIYDENHAHFGTENDTDGNGKVIVVFSQELTGGLLGYFYGADKYPKTTYADSNEGDIFYMTTDAAYQGGVVNGTLAHEFQHMIYFDEHYDRGVTSTYSWLNEALSQAAEFYNGLTDNHEAWIAYFLNNHWAGLSLTHWTPNNYGYGAIYIRYLIDQYGDTAIRNMCATNLVGISAVENATGANFNTIFNNFTRALVISGTGDTADTRYNFQTLNLKTVQPAGRGGLVTAGSYSAGTPVSGSLYPYRLSFIAWTGSFGTMSLSGTDMGATAFGLSN